MIVVTASSASTQTWMSVLKMLLVLAVCAGQVYFITAFFSSQGGKAKSMGFSAGRNLFDHQGIWSLKVSMITLACSSVSFSNFWESNGPSLTGHSMPASTRVLCFASSFSREFVMVSNTLPFVILSRIWKAFSAFARLEVGSSPSADLYVKDHAYMLRAS